MARTLPDRVSFPSWSLWDGWEIREQFLFVPVYFLNPQVAWRMYISLYIYIYIYKPIQIYTSISKQMKSIFFMAHKIRQKFLKICPHFPYIIRYEFEWQYHTIFISYKSPIQFAPWIFPQRSSRSLRWSSWSWPTKWPGWPDDLVGEHGLFMGFNHEI